MAMLPHEPCSIVVRPSPASKPPRLSFSLLLLLEWAPRSSAPRGRPMSDMRDAIVVLLAGGQGERLWPLTRDRAKPAVPFGARSEEHTSELQSHLNLVCRLLLEKKK